MANVNCVPEDSYEVVMQCDATLAQADSECNYQKTIGTAFSESLSTSMSVDYTVSAKLKVEFFEFFTKALEFLPLLDMIGLQFLQKPSVKRIPFQSPQQQLLDMWPVSNKL